LIWSVVTLMIWALAPDPRFISYLLFSALILIFYLLIAHLSSIILFRMRKFFYLVTLNIVLLILLSVNTNLRPSESKIVPLSELKFNSFPLSTSTLVFYPADEKFDRCWNLSFPCIPSFDPELRLITISINDGFKRRNWTLPLIYFTLCYHNCSLGIKVNQNQLTCDVVSYLT
jgi:hypothetical protein